MVAPVSEYEAEALPELRASYAAGSSYAAHEAESESEQFFGALANLARRGAGWLTAPGSPQRQLALSCREASVIQPEPTKSFSHTVIHSVL